jgi:hypothetical protein
MEDSPRSRYESQSQDDSAKETMHAWANYRRGSGTPPTANN